MYFSFDTDINCLLSYSFLSYIVTYTVSNTSIFGFVLTGLLQFYLVFYFAAQLGLNSLLELSNVC